MGNASPARAAGCYTHGVPIGVVTDSTCDLSNATLLSLGVAVVPLRIHLDHAVYRDGRDLEPTTLYHHMTHRNTLPTIAAPTPKDFISTYTRYLGLFDQVVSLHLSSSLSNTLTRAQEAVATLGAEARVSVIDTQQTSAGLSELVLLAAREAATGTSVTALREHLGAAQAALLTLISPGSARWLHRRGSVTKAKRTLSSVLGRRLLLSLEQGSLVPVADTPQKHTLEAMLARVQTRFGTTPLHLTLAFTHLDEGEVARAKEIAQQSCLTLVSGRVQRIGTALGGYMGPGTVAVCALPAEHAQGSLRATRFC